MYGHRKNETDRERNAVHGVLDSIETNATYHFEK